MNHPGASAAGALREAEHRVARVLAETGETDAAYDAILEAIGSNLDWEFGAAWEAESEGERVVRCVAVWCAPPLERASFDVASRETVLAEGEGLPGRVVATGEPAWIDDVRVDPNFPRARAAAEAGLHAGLSFPVQSGHRVLGAMEFFTRELRAPDDDLLETLASLGSQIGQFVARRRSEEAVRHSEARMRAMLESALDSVVTIDAHGRVLGFNAAAEATFGYRASDVIGRELAELIVPPSLRQRHRRGLGRYLRTRQPVLLDRRIEITGMRSDGTEFPVELAVTRIAVDGPPVFTGYLRDITERKRAEEQLRASRARIVRAGDRERKRLERNLHDGAQQRLVSASLALRTSRATLETAPEEALKRLSLAQDEIAEALQELRDLARGLHPAILTERGLGLALEALAMRAPVPVELTFALEGRLPEPVEEAAYYFVTEAVTNVVKHAKATRVLVDVSRDGDAAIVTVTDDGVGGVDARRGSGITGLQDRIESLEGQLTVVSDRRNGTQVRAEFRLTGDG